MVPQKYSRPLPLVKVEAALRDTIYDSYIRQILVEGVLDSWTNDIPNWLTCPTQTLPSRPTSEILISRVTFTLLGVWKSAVGIVHGGVQTIMSKLNPKMGVSILPDGPIICPYYWAQPIHQLNCDVVWPVELDDPRFSSPFDLPVAECIAQEDIDVSDDDDRHLEPCSSLDERVRLIQLDSPKYSGVIAQRMIVEKLLAQSGIRLAGILNYIFAPKDDQNQQGLFIINIDD